MPLFSFPLTSHQRRALALEAVASERTVRRAYLQPSNIREATRIRLAAAAERLGLPTPPGSSERKPAA